MLAHWQLVNNHSGTHVQLEACLSNPPDHRMTGRPRRRIIKGTIVVISIMS